MQYILTQEELDALRAKQTHFLKLTRGNLQKLCTRIANEMPVKWGWGGPDPKPWTCRLSPEYDNDEWYCDKCPVQDICPSDDKEWSK